MVVVKCNRCGVHDATWTFELALFGYHSICEDCHTCVKQLLLSIDSHLRRLPETQALLVLGFVDKQLQGNQPEK